MYTPVGLVLLCSGKMYWWRRVGRVGGSGGGERCWCPISSQYWDTLPVLQIVGCMEGWYHHFYVFLCNNSTFVPWHKGETGNEARGIIPMKVEWSLNILCDIIHNNRRVNVYTSTPKILIFILTFQIHRHVCTIMYMSTTHVGLRL